MPYPEHARGKTTDVRIMNDYIKGDKTIAFLAKKWGISKNGLYRRAAVEEWEKKRKEWVARVGARSAEVIFAKQVQDHVRLYDATRRVVDMMAAVAERVCVDPDGFFKHLVQRETINQDGGLRDTEKWVEEKTFSTVNSKTYADMAKGLKDVAMLARVLDGILDAADAAKNDIERERLALEKQKVGLDNDIESESGIAIMPAVDMSLLDGALPDPGEPGEDSIDVAEVKE